MLRVPQHHPGHRQRGPGFCAISGRSGTSSGTQTTRPIPSPAFQSPLTPLFPLLTQKRGGGGALKKLSATSDQRSGGKRKNRSEDRPLQRRGDARPGAPSGTHTTRPTPSPALKKLLSPIIPVHPRNSPVSPIIPVHTQKQGGGALKKLPATSDQEARRKQFLLPPSVARHSPLPTRH